VSLGPYDLMMLVLLAVTTLFGLWKGMAWQVASIASLVLSGLVAVRFGPELAPRLSQQEPWNRFLAMLVLFLCTSAAVWLVFQAIARLIDRIHLKEFDRQAGALFGLAKGVLLCLVVTFFAVTLSDGSRQMVLNSASGHYIAVFIRNARPVLPEEVRTLVGGYLDTLEQELQGVHLPGAPEPPKPVEPEPVRPFPSRSHRGWGV
jgi:membrane protein required for colicin V production